MSLRSRDIEPSSEVGFEESVGREERFDVDPFVFGVEFAAQWASHDDGDVLTSNEAGIGSSVFPKFAGRVTERFRFPSTRWPVTGRSSDRSWRRACSQLSRRCLGTVGDHGWNTFFAIRCSHCWKCRARQYGSASYVVVTPPSNLKFGKARLPPHSTQRWIKAVFWTPEPTTQ